MILEKSFIKRGYYPELTSHAVLVGYFLGILITLSVAYASLVLGFSIEGNELAAILGFGLLRGVFKRTSIVENNINQTLAVAVNSASAGMMFSVPALFILNYTDFNPYVMVFGCMTGTVLGIAFIIPLRKQMIDYERLTFPGGVAVATILKSPGAGRKKVFYMLVAMAFSAVIHLLSQLLHFENINVGAWLHFPEYMNTIFYVSLMTLGVAYIAGKGGFYFVVGGYLCYWILAPALDIQGLLPSADVLAGASMPTYLRNFLFKPIGIGMLVGGALTGILFAFPLIIGAIKNMHEASKLKTRLSLDEFPIKLLYFAIIGAVISLFFFAYISVQEMDLTRALLMGILGTLWIWVSGVILSECLGRTNWSPLSGMTLIAVTILLIIASGLGTRGAIVSSVMVGAAACVAMAQATGLMMDLKAGFLVGASPKKQQIAQFMGGLLGPVIVMTLIFVLHKAYVIGSEKLPSPQGQALASMISAILGGDIPIQKYLSGVGFGALLSSTGLGGLGIMVGLGFYMPFNIVLTYTIGSVLRIVVDKKKGIEFTESVGIPVAAGLIVGEALMGVGFAIYNIIAGMGA